MNRLMSINFPEELYNKLSQRAEDEFTTKSEFVRRAVVGVLND